MTPPRDELDARLDRVLEATTTPRRDAAFRARVIAALERPASPGARGWRFAVPVAAAAALVALVVVWAWWGPSGAPPAEQQARREHVALPSSERATPRAPATGDATNERPLGGRSGSNEQPRRRDAIGLDRRALLLAEDEERIPRIVVPNLSVRAIDIEPLADSSGFEQLDFPERIDVDPVVVEALDGSR